MTFQMIFFLVEMAKVEQKVTKIEWKIVDLEDCFV